MRFAAHGSSLSGIFPCPPPGDSPQDHDRLDRLSPATTSDDRTVPGAGTAAQHDVASSAVDAGPVSQLFEEGRLSVTLSDGWPVLIVDTRQGPVAVQGRCPHMGASLSEGEVRRSTIRCTGHGLRYDLRSGACRSRHALAGRLRRYDVWIDEGRVMVGEAAS